MIVSPVICPRIRSNSFFVICTSSPLAAILVSIIGILEVIPFEFDDQFLQEYFAVSLFIVAIPTFSPMLKFLLVLRTLY